MDPVYLLGLIWTMHSATLPDCFQWFLREIIFSYFLLSELYENMGQSNQTVSSSLKKILGPGDHIC